MQKKILTTHGLERQYDSPKQNCSPLIEISIFLNITGKDFTDSLNQISNLFYNKGIEFLPLAYIFLSQYLFNMLV